jgi:undecaprenyl-diphosphatase
VNEYLLSVLLGVVEGLTEFLPVSSTAHIRLVFAAVGGDMDDGFWKMFAVAIQFPAILAVVVYFRSRIMDFLRSFLAIGIKPAELLKHPLALVAIAFVVTAVPAALLSEDIKHNLGSIVVMGWALIIGGIVMWVVDVLVKNPHTLRMEDMKPWQAATIGAVQILSAVFPGTSRSMATIAGGQLAGLSRQAALEFSFFLSIPIMAAACSFDLLESMRAAPDSEAYVGVMTTARWIQLALGGVTSFFVAWAVIAWFMNWVKKHGFVAFAVYRIVIGVVVLVLAYRGVGQ